MRTFFFSEVGVFVRNTLFKHLGLVSFFSPQNYMMNIIFVSLHVFYVTFDQFKAFFVE